MTKKILIIITALFITFSYITTSIATSNIYSTDLCILEDINYAIVKNDTIVNSGTADVTIYKEEEIMPDLSSDQKSYYYISEETMREVVQTLKWSLNSLGWFLDYADSKDYVDRWHEAYDPEGAIKALHSAIAKLKEASEATPDFSIDTLKRIILKQDFLLDKIMSVCIHAGSVNDFPERECRALLKDIFTTWGEVWTEHEPLCNIIHELEYEYRAKRNKEE